MTEHVVLVDEQDREVGTMEKLQAHAAPRLHRAVSVVLCSPGGSLLMQRRALHKYHSAGLWSNTCCGHPRPGEGAGAAAVRRLREEMGIECALHPAVTLIYRISVGDHLHEHELNQVFVGVFDDEPSPNPAEVSEWKWASIDAVRKWRRDNPAELTPWFGLVLDALQGWRVSEPVMLPEPVRALHAHFE